MLKRIVNIMFYAISIFLMIFILLEVFMPDKTIDYLGIKTYVVLTPSMEPDINVDDVIVVKKTNMDNIEVGDAISFNVFVRNLGKEVIVTHYVGDIVEENGEKIYKTLGATATEFDVWYDANNDEIEIGYDDIVGEVLFRVPYAGHGVKIARNPVMLLLILFNVIIIYVLIKVIKFKPKEKK